MVAAVCRLHLSQDAREDTSASDEEMRVADVSPVVVCSSLTAAEAVRKREMESALDDGNMALALRLARGLMHSPKPELRSAALAVFSWIGRRAFAEIVQMMSDADERISEEALVACESAIEEEPYERIKCMRIEQAVSRLAKRSFVDALLLHYTGVDQSTAISSIDNILNKVGSGSIVYNSAKEMKEHLL